MAAVRPAPAPLGVRSATPSPSPGARTPESVRSGTPPPAARTRAADDAVLGGVLGTPATPQPLAPGGGGARTGAFGPGAPGATPAPHARPRPPAGAAAGDDAVLGGLMGAAPAAAAAGAPRPPRPAAAGGTAAAGDDAVLGGLLGARPPAHDLGGAAAPGKQAASDDAVLGSIVAGGPGRQAASDDAVLGSVVAGGAAATARPSAQADDAVLAAIVGGAGSGGDAPATPAGDDAVVAGILAGRAAPLPQAEGDDELLGSALGGGQQQHDDAALRGALLGTAPGSRGGAPVDAGWLEGRNSLRLEEDAALAALLGPPPLPSPRAGTRRPGQDLSARPGGAKVRGQAQALAAGLLHADDGRGLLFAALRRGAGLCRQDLFRYSVTLHVVPRPSSDVVNLVLDLLPFDASLRISRAAWTRTLERWQSHLAPTTPGRVSPEANSFVHTPARSRPPPAAAGAWRAAASGQTPLGLNRSVAASSAPTPFGLPRHYSPLSPGLPAGSIRSLSNSAGMRWSFGVGKPVGVQ